MSQLERGISVSQAISKFPQSTGGFLKPVPIKFVGPRNSETIIRREHENVSSQIVGTAVDTLTRNIVDNRCPSLGHPFRRKGVPTYSSVNTPSLKRKMNELNNDHAIRVCCGYSGPSPNEKTISNIRTMVRRTVDFLLNEGEIKTNFDFTQYQSDFITKGNLDFIAGNTLWDLKVSRDPFTIKHTLQVLIYHVMYSWTLGGCYLKHIGLYNPRLSTSYKYDMTLIDPTVYARIQSLVLYGNAVNTVMAAAEARIRGEQAGWLEKIIIPIKQQEEVKAVQPEHKEPVKPKTVETPHTTEQWRSEKFSKVGFLVWGLILLALAYIVYISYPSRSDSVEPIKSDIPTKVSNVTPAEKYPYNMDKLSSLPIHRYTRNKKNSELIVDIYYDAHAEVFNYGHAKHYAEGAFKNTYYCNAPSAKRPEKVTYVFHFLKGGNRIYMALPLNYMCQ